MVRESDIDPTMLRGMNLSVSDCGKQVLELKALLEQKTRAITRIRNLHSDWTLDEICDGCGNKYPCDTIIRLDGE